MILEQKLRLLFIGFLGWCLDFQSQLSDKFVSLFCGDGFSFKSFIIGQFKGKPKMIEIANFFFH